MGRGGERIGEKVQGISKIGRYKIDGGGGVLRIVWEMENLRIYMYDSWT